MIAAAEAEFRSALTGGNSDNESPNPPYQLEHLLRYFYELHEWRGIDRGGEQIELRSLSYSDLLAWASLTGRNPTVFEISVLAKLDAAFWRVRYGQDEATVNRPRSFAKQFASLVDPVERKPMRKVEFNPRKK